MLRCPICLHSEYSTEPDPYCDLCLGVGAIAGLDAEAWKHPREYALIHDTLEPPPFVPEPTHDTTPSPPPDDDDGWA